MSEYKIFIQERNRIDHLVQQGYKITSVIENLNGSFVDFDKGTEDEQETLRIITPQGRKYFAVVLIRQQQIGIHNAL